MLESLKKLFGFGPKVNYAELVQQGAVVRCGDGTSSLIILASPNFFFTLYI